MSGGRRGRRRRPSGYGRAGAAGHAGWCGLRTRRAASCSCGRSGPAAHGRSPRIRRRASTRQKRAPVCRKSASSSRSQAFVGTSWITAMVWSRRCHYMRRGHPLVGAAGPRPSRPCRTPTTLLTAKPLTRAHTEARLEYQTRKRADFERLVLPASRVRSTESARLRIHPKNPQCVSGRERRGDASPNISANVSGGSGRRAPPGGQGDGSVRRASAAAVSVARATFFTSASASVF